MTAELSAVLSQCGSGSVDPINKSIDYDKMRAHVLKLASSVLVTLDNRLKQYNGFGKTNSGFYGPTNITTIDCLIFGYLATVIGAPWKSQDLQELVRSHTSLIQFVDDMSAKLFPEVPKPSITGAPNYGKNTDKQIFAKTTVNAILLVAFCGFLISQSPYKRMIYFHAQRIRRSWASFLNWMYPSTESSLKTIPVLVGTQKTKFMDKLEKFDQIAYNKSQSKLKIDDGLYSAL